MTHFLFRSGPLNPDREIVVAPEPSERSRADVPALEIDIGRDIRVRISATAPAELATAVIKVLAPR